MNHPFLLSVVPCSETQMLDAKKLKIICKQTMYKLTSVLVTVFLYGPVILNHGLYSVTLNLLQQMCEKQTLDRLEFKTCKTHQKDT